jgi:hypothetical protein
MTGDGLPAGCVGRKGDRSQWRASLPLTCANPTRDTFLGIERQANERLGDRPKPAGSHPRLRIRAAHKKRVPSGTQGLIRALLVFGGNPMATNKPAGDGHRNGAVRKRSQLKDGIFGKETKRDTATGEFMAQKKDGGKFKGVRKER